jgi:hypothetical protein
MYSSKKIYLLRNLAAGVHLGPDRTPYPPPLQVYTLIYLSTLGGAMNQREG